MDDDATMVWKHLELAGGQLPFHDKSDPEVIKKAFGLSKAAFKRAVGHLLKEGKIRITDSGIEMVSK
jgi:predicted RNA-binding protein (virulence factor B family)